MSETTLVRLANCGEGDNDNSNTGGDSVSNVDGSAVDVESTANDNGAFAVLLAEFKDLSTMHGWLQQQMVQTIGDHGKELAGLKKDLHQARSQVESLERIVNEGGCADFSVFLRVARDHAVTFFIEKKDGNGWAIWDSGTWAVDKASQILWDRRRKHPDLIFRMIRVDSTVQVLEE